MARGGTTTGMGRQGLQAATDEIMVRWRCAKAGKVQRQYYICPSRDGRASIVREG